MCILMVTSMLIIFCSKSIFEKTAWRARSFSIRIQTVRTQTVNLDGSKHELQTESI